jgi:hypothetical protein
MHRPGQAPSAVLPEFFFIYQDEHWAPQLDGDQARRAHSFRPDGPGCAGAAGETSAGWHGDLNGRIPLLHHQRALIMTSTIFGKDAYDDGIRDAIGMVTDDTSTYPRLSSTVPTCRKSAPRIPAARARRNCRHAGPDRRGAGSMPAARRISRTAGGATAMPGMPAAMASSSTIPNDSP